MLVGIVKMVMVVFVALLIIKFNYMEKEKIFYSYDKNGNKIKYIEVPGDDWDKLNEGQCEILVKSESKGIRLVKKY